MMIQNIQNLTLKLISLDTSPENQKNLYQALEYIQEELSEFDFQIYEKQGVKSILFYNIFPKDGHFSLILNSHLDIIPAKKEQFIPRIGEGKIFGAGALDMKGALACALYAFKTTAKNVSYPLAFQVVTDEEVGGYKGTKYQIESGISSDFVIATEPTNFDIVHKAKGVFQFEIITRGVTAHSAYPWRGKNAIQHMLEFMNRFQKRFKNPEQDMWETSYNFSQIQTPDYGYNKIPDICRLKIDMRYIQEEREKLEAEIRSFLPKQAEIHIYAKEPLFYTNPHANEIQEIATYVGEIAQKKSRIYGANGTSDGRHYQKNAIEFGPIGANIGADNEWVDIQSLEDYYDILCVFMKKREKSR